MGKIFYSLAGEGRGHATRVRAMVEVLRAEHDIVIYAPAMAYDFLAQAYQESPVRVKRIPGLCFTYTRKKTLNYWATGWHGLKTIATYPQLVRQLRCDVENEQPDLVITDFEPSLPYAAQLCGIPYISLTHQHFLISYDLGSLPLRLQLQARFMAWFVKAFYSNQIQTIVSSFYFPPLRPNQQNVQQIGVLLRPEILQAVPEQGQHLVAYLRRSISPELFRALVECGSEVRIYGLGVQPSVGALHFCKVDAYRFVEDLATSRALISTAGNQLIGEALFLGKPVLAMPECGNYEQRINAHFLNRSGAGVAINMQAVTVRHIRRVLERFQDISQYVDRQRLNGNLAALRILCHYLPGRPQRQVRPLQEVFA